MDSGGDSTDTSPQGRWDLWLLGIGVAVLLVIFLVEPFMGGGPPKPQGPWGGPPIATVNPPDDWFSDKHAHLFQIRITTTKSYDKNGVSFDLPEEKKRLEAWLMKNDNRTRLRTDPLKISEYHALGKAAGGRVSKHLQWFPHRVRSLETDPNRFARPISRHVAPRTGLEHVVVTLFSPEEFDQGPVPGRRELVEYVPVNMHERWFGLKDLDLTQTYAGKDDRGDPAFHYQIKASQQAIYSDFTDEHMGVESPIIVGGNIVAAPFFASRIMEGRGLITGLTQKELQALVEGIRQALPR